MDKEKEIEEIVQHACNREGISKRCPQRIAEALISAGYGNIKEFAKLATHLIHERLDTEIDYTPSMICNDIFENLIKELYGEDYNES